MTCEEQFLRFRKILHSKIKISCYEVKAVEEQERILWNLKHVIPKIGLVEELLLILRAELQNVNIRKSSLCLKEHIRKLSFDKNNARNKLRLDPGKFIKDI